MVGSLVTKRLLTKTNGIPPLAERLVGKVGNSVKIVEESVVDPVNKVSGRNYRGRGSMSALNKYSDLFMRSLSLQKIFKPCLRLFRS